ncbi:MAG: radical SAM protein [Thermoproteus sp.]
MKIVEIRTDRGLAKSGLPEYDYALNPYLGCLHACRYCYAKDFTRGEPGEHWGEVVYVKVNLPEVLAREVKAYSPGVVGVSTITDPYQPVEAKYRLTRRSLEVLLQAGFKASIQTKSTFVLKDMDLFFVYRDKVDVGITITTYREEAARLLEPKAPPPRARAYALHMLSELGVKTWVFLGPLLQGVNDGEEDYMPVLEVAKKTKSEVIIDRYRPRPGADSMLSALGLRPRIDRGWWARKAGEIKARCVELGVVCRTAEEEWAAARRADDLRRYL